MKVCLALGNKVIYLATSMTTLSRSWVLLGWYLVFFTKLFLKSPQLEFVLRLIKILGFSLQKGDDRGIGIWLEFKIFNWEFWVFDFDGNFWDLWVMGFQDVFFFFLIKVNFPRWSPSGENGNRF